MSLQPTPIFAFDNNGGLQTNKKPLLLSDQAFQKLSNAYPYRDRIEKRKGLQLLGRLQRILTSESLGNTPAGPPNTITLNILSSISLAGVITAISNANPGQVTSDGHNLVNGDQITISGVQGMTQVNGGPYTITVVDPDNFTIGIDTSAFGVYSSGGLWRNISEPDASITPGTVVITIGAPDTATFTDNGDGTFSVTGSGVASGSYINYNTGTVVLVFSALTGGGAITVDFDYYPSLPVMGIWQREIAAINDEQTIWFDEKYAYIYNGTDFQEFIPGTTWDSTDSDFFWCTNYRGINPQDRLFFTTNFVNTAANPMRYTDGTTWTTFTPAVDASNSLFSARILIPYYGRLLALNTWEGASVGAAVNIFNRCRFSQIGNPVAADAWRSDQFGKGGFLDAPTNEAITSARFIKNTLLVSFENSTWQLRYVGEYGLPFIWERVAADLGSESTFSTVFFDRGVLMVGDKAIIRGDSSEVDRIDLNIPDQIFKFKNSNNGVKRVWGARDYQRELVFWNYADAEANSISETGIVFPNRMLVFNYRNNTWAIFRDNVTAIGTFQLENNILWDSQIVFWDDESITWDDFFSQTLFPAITIGNQEGFVHLYGYKTPDDPSLSITDIDLSGPITITSINHNLETGEIIYLTDLQFLNNSTFEPLTTNLNEELYRVRVVDADTFVISKWDFFTKMYKEDFSFTPDPSQALYIGGGQITLFPKLEVQTKDFNIYQTSGLQTKLSYIDFLLSSTPSAAMSIQLNMNSSPAIIGNMLVGNQNVSSSLTSPFYGPASDYAWHRFYATAFGQYFNILMTYNDDLMNTLATHQQKWELQGLVTWTRPGGKLVF